MLEEIIRIGAIYGIFAPRPRSLGEIAHDIWLRIGEPVDGHPAVSSVGARSQEQFHQPLRITLQI
jgi:hypothetical protein